MEITDERHPVNELKYSTIEKLLLPAAESLKDTVERFLPYWNETIKQSILNQQKVLIVAHGNSLRALVKSLDNISDEDVITLNIPIGIPLIYELDKELRSIEHYYLGDSAAVAQATKAVADQGLAR